MKNKNIQNNFEAALKNENYSRFLINIDKQTCKICGRKIDYEIIPFGQDLKILTFTVSYKRINYSSCRKCYKFNQTFNDIMFVILKFLRKI